MMNMLSYQMFAKLVVLIISIVVGIISGVAIGGAGVICSFYFPSLLIGAGSGIILIGFGCLINPSFKTKEGEIDVNACVRVLLLITILVGINFFFRITSEISPLLVALDIFGLLIGALTICILSMISSLLVRKLTQCCTRSGFSITKKSKSDI